ncbi:hypothetical protein BLA29_002187 [Euroglyphus maynei]|uniref:Lateral signaling target protein 2-like protein n=1 Tax=Euroglyphus maynei TaxID=6958 RepID=A0A1Y3BCK2_EURMA|nr:hypothetical protein BLA29_002187 [Euroglyphus maynei]
MSSIRKWLASKVFSSVLSNDGNHHLNVSNGSNTNGDNGGFSSLFGSSFSSPSTSSSGVGAISRNGDAYAIPGSSQDQAATILSTLDTSQSNVENQSYFSVIYHHYKSRIRKHQIQTATIQPNDKLLITLMYQFYQANEELNYTSSELDTFDGRKDTDRCSALVNSLKKTQDRVISLIFSIMDEIGCERASREYRLKFPDELLTGEGIESLNSQIWFGAECLTAGSTITNNQDKSNYLRPIAINLTTTLDQIRYELRSCCNYLPKTPRISKDLIRKLENFDNLFSSFEYDYVKAMLQIKNCEDIENLQELTILFSETLSYSLRKGLISKDEVDGCQPSVMIALPRLSIIRGLLQGFGSVVCKHDPTELTTILRPYHSLLLEFHEFLMNLSDDEVFFLERLLSTNHDNLIDYSADNQAANISSLMMIESHQQHQDSQLAIFNKFFRHAKRMKDSCPRNPELTTNHLHHSHNYHDEDDDTNQLQSIKKHQSVTTSTILRKSLLTNRYISASVDFLSTNNVRNDSANNNGNGDESGNSNTVNPQRYSPYKSNEALFRFNSLPNINFNLTNDFDDENVDIHNPVHKRSSIISRDYSSSSATTSTSSSSSCPSVSITCSSSSSISVELDFLKQIKDMLKRTQLKTLTKNRNFCSQQQQQTQHRSTSSGGVATNSNVQPMNEILANPRAKTAADRRRSHHHHDLHHNEIHSNSHCADQHSAQKTSTAAMFTPTTSTFSNNSVHFDLGIFIR